MSITQLPNQVAFDAMGTADKDKYLLNTTHTHLLIINSSNQLFRRLKSDLANTLTLGPARIPQHDRIRLLDAPCLRRQ